MAGVSGKQRFDLTKWIYKNKKKNGGEHEPWKLHLLDIKINKEASLPL